MPFTRLMARYGGIRALIVVIAGVEGESIHPTRRAASGLRTQEDEVEIRKHRPLALSLRLCSSCHAGTLSSQYGNSAAVIARDLRWMRVRVPL
jgi:hypothetical protein